MMYDDHEVAVVVSAFNEAGFVADVLDSLPDYVDRVYAVDDRSTDDTWREIQRIVVRAAEQQGTTPQNWACSDSGTLARRIDQARCGGRFVAIRHARNVGPGGAVKTGYLAALSETADLVATIDGDGQMDPAILDWFLEPLVDEAAGYTTGSRFLRSGDLREMPRFRRFGNGVLTLLARWATGYLGLSDPVNGYTAATADALDRIDVEGIHGGYGYGIDVLTSMNVADVAVCDVAHASRYGDETSSISYRTYIPQVSRVLLANGTRRRQMEDRVPAGGTPVILLLGIAAVARCLGIMDSDEGRNGSGSTMTGERMAVGDANGRDEG